MKITNFPKDIYTEPTPSVDTLGNLGPLRPMAGVWVNDIGPFDGGPKAAGLKAAGLKTAGLKVDRSQADASRSTGVDVNPKPAGPETQSFIEHIELQPIDAQTNGPQLFYGLRYHTHIVKPGEVETFHDQVGYWLWEPATGTVIQTLTIPRAQSALAVGLAKPDATSFQLTAERGSTTNGIVSGAFLEYAFKTQRYTISITIHPDGTWSYEEETVLIIPGQSEPFHHKDRNRFRKVAEPTLNPTAMAARMAAK